jgi:transposase-like protein
MKDVAIHLEAFESYYLLRNVSAVSREVGVSRNSVGKWKAKYNWDAECEDRDREVLTTTRKAMMPEWVSVKTDLIEAFIDQIKNAKELGIAPENSRDMVAVSRELRALLGESEKVEIEFTGIEYVLQE